MGKRRHARAPRSAQAVAVAEPEANWDHRSGYSGSYPTHVFDGSKFRGSLAYPAAYDLDYSALRLRSRLAAWESTEAGALFCRLADNVVGSGLQLQSSPIWDLIDNPRLEKPEDREKYTQQIELRFWLWANSPEASADYRLTLQEMQAFVFRNLLRDGETAHVLRYADGKKDRISPLSIQHIDPEQIETPLGKQAESDAKIRGNRIKDGVEISASGEMIALHVKDPETCTYTRVTTWGGAGAGRRWVLHPIISDLIGATRGTPWLAPMLHELEKLTTYKTAELECAINNAVILGYIETEIAGTKGPGLGAGASLRTGAAPSSSQIDGTPQRSAVSEAGIWIQSLGKGQKLSTLDTKHPNAGFEAYVNAVERSLGASVGIGREVLHLLFSNNYSASRATLILFWKTVTHWRDFLVAQFLRPVYEAWFGEEIRAGRLVEVGEAWGDPIKRAAWLNATWDGDSLPSIDPLKDAQADDARIAQGATTREAVARKYNGSDFAKNVQRLAEENKQLDDAQVKAAPMDPATGKPPVPPSDEPGKDDPADGGK